MTWPREEGRDQGKFPPRQARQRCEPNENIQRKTDYRHIAGRRGRPPVGAECARLNNNPGTICKWRAKHGGMDFGKARLTQAIGEYTTG